MVKVTEWAGQGKIELSISKHLLYSLWKWQHCDKTPFPPCRDTKCVSLRFAEVALGERGGPGVPKGAGLDVSDRNWNGRVRPRVHNRSGQGWGWPGRAVGTGQDGSQRLVELILNPRAGESHPEQNRNGKACLSLPLVCSLPALGTPSCWGGMCALKPARACCSSPSSFLFAGLANWGSICPSFMDVWTVTQLVGSFS